VMAIKKAEVRFMFVGSPPRLMPFITIGGRQAMHEGPRRIGHCVYCKGQCRGVTVHCESRVYEETSHWLKLKGGK
jgi:hypothetical protein